YATVEFGILTILIVVVLIHLAGVVWWIGNHDTDWGGLLAVDALRILRIEHNRHVLLFVPFAESVIRHFPIDGLKRIHKADALERLVFAGGLVVGMLDIHR